MINLNEHLFCNSFVSLSWDDDSGDTSSKDQQKQPLLDKSAGNKKSKKTKPQKMRTSSIDFSSIPEVSQRLQYDDYVSADCTPSLSLLSDSEDFSTSSCGTDEFFDLEDNAISNALHLIDHWQQKPEKRVRFDKAQVREYALIVGDHPVCQDGLALSLDWKHSKERVYKIDDYEQKRRQKRPSLKHIKPKGIMKRRISKLDYWQRREILQRIGSYTNTELSRMECLRSQEAVSDFLIDAKLDGFGPSNHEQGVELLEVELGEGIGCNDSFYIPDMEKNDWQMKVQVLED